MAGIEGTAGAKGTEAREGDRGMLEGAGVLVYGRGRALTWPGVGL